MSKCAFLGLGVMGAPMAGHLARHGHDVKVWNRTAKKALDWSKSYRGEPAKDAADAVFGSEYVFMCLGDDPDVEEVFDAIEPNLAAGMIVVDHTTASAELARRLHARCEARGASFIDAPISGGQAGAENGKLTIMCGGDAAGMEKAIPVMKAYGHRITHIGESGAGQLAKSVNQICIAGIVQGLSEGIHFAERNGLSVEKVIEAISGGAAQSWQMDNRWKTMSEREFDHGFAVDWMRKDLRIALDAARASGASLPVTALVDQFYADVQAMGGRRWDTSSLLNRLNSKKAD
ncbi:NAD(P)-dependent oxidoreductase [Henriciella mobilis]|uniref:NAD(P)-dependent oxidoreductase n=1 Tax=Henriciella mobilis TaxID=2305467 RepID=A0A399RC37_9PROT|nr:NAD(P)-dependent oxidoreductase [Henriciella mobilis]RIJ28243.1 NAD(P)-dependent oxidoreductase [Henriciella mobilis]